MLPRPNRITGAELRQTMPRSQSYPSDWGIIRYHEGEVVHIACIVSKKVAKSSPDRHRIKRRLYALFQSRINNLKPGYYYLFPNRSVLTTANDKLASQIDASLQRFAV